MASVTLHRLRTYEHQESNGLLRGGLVEVSSGSKSLVGNNGKTTVKKIKKKKKIGTARPKYSEHKWSLAQKIW